MSPAAQPPRADLLISVSSRVLEPHKWTMISPLLVECDKRLFYLNTNCADLLVATSFFCRHFILTKFYLLGSWSVNSTSIHKTNARYSTDHIIIITKIVYIAYYAWCVFV